MPNTELPGEELAQRGAHALMRKMPAAAVIADQDLRIVECNPRFARSFGLSGHPEPAALEGADLAGLVPFYTLFEDVLRTGEEILDKEIRFRGAVYRASIFLLEEHAAVGATLMDVTEAAGRKEEIIQRTRQVIRKNLATVQQIAYLMGENAAASEIALNTIVKSFASDRVERRHGNGRG